MNWRNWKAKDAVSSPWPMAGYPYANVIGKKLNAPESIRDIAPELSEKYQDYLEGEWLKRLHGQYKYKIYKKALKRLVPKK